jgi:hypothetical protein
MKNSIRGVLVIFSLMTLISLWGACGSSVVAPTVSSTTASGKVFTTDPISVTFSRVMDQSSVEGAFQITGSDPVSGTFSWSDETVTFNPDALWKTHHLYTLTIGVGAKDTNGIPFQAKFTQTFTPELNLHDVNGDRIDDFMLGAPGHDFDSTTLNSGQAYLFLGKTAWSDVNLATQTADATYTQDGENAFFGLSAMVVGDINGDGYADMAMSAPTASVGGILDNGFVIIVLGSANPTSITLSGDNVDGAFMGSSLATYLGFPVMPVGDVNGDGLADFVVAGFLSSSGDSKFWLILGRTSAFPPPSALAAVDTVADANFIVEGNILIINLPVIACDINGDELDDLILGAPEMTSGAMRGKAFVIAGSTTPTSIDLRTAAASETLAGASDGDLFSASLACGDVNGDGYDDLLAGAPHFGTNIGRSYLVAGAATFQDRDFSTDSPTAAYTGGSAETWLGLTGCVPGDINDDGFDDIIAGAPAKIVEGSNDRGEAYLFLGKESPQNEDLGAGGSADATYTGVIPPAGTATALGFCKPVGDVNGDDIDDLLLGAPFATGGGSEKGQAYLVFGSEAAPASINFETQSADATFTGAADFDFLTPIAFED